MRDPMVCPACGIVMNHHADKLVYDDAHEVVKEFHSCPNCGRTESRTAE
jgi:ribosomal protein S27AE